MSDALQRISSYLQSRDSRSFLDIDLIHSMKSSEGRDEQLLESDLRQLVTELNSHRGVRNGLLQPPEPSPHQAFAEGSGVGQCDAITQLARTESPATECPVNRGVLVLQHSAQEHASTHAGTVLRETAVMTADEHALHFDLSGDIASTRAALCVILEQLERPSALSLSRGFLKNSSFKRIFINGPLRHGESCNRTHFHKAAEVLRHSKWHVAMPHHHGSIRGLDWADFMQHDLGQLATCDSIFALPHWSKSKGASLLMHFAHIQGIEIIYAEGAEAYMALPGVHLSTPMFAEQVAQRQHPSVRETLLETPQA